MSYPEDDWGGTTTAYSGGSAEPQAYTSNSIPSDNQSWSAGGGGGGGSGGGIFRLNVRSQLTVEKLPGDTPLETIRSIFGRYGRISRVVCDYKVSEDRLMVWIDYEDPAHATVALRENGRKMNRNTITVQKNTNASDDGGFAARKPRKESFGQGSGWSREPRGGGGGGSNNNSFADTSGTGGGSGGGGGDDSWNTPSWDSSGDNSFGNSDSFRGERRGRGGFRGERRGGRGDRGRGRGNRYQPYDKDDSSFGGSSTVDWDALVNQDPKSSSSDPPENSYTAVESDWN
ncbi:uncharacterized protein LOC141852523 [Brevipalpus obovatus]|uniref:uncharacterized protein LOC141852523 n=1 Tax=Brevipalpus obovatus TaxID=246614 RepID=UPI003D9E02DA